MEARTGAITTTSSSGYRIEDAAKLVGWSPRRVKALVREGVLGDEAGELGFQDLVLLRAARGLSDARVTTRQILRSLERLREQLPDGKPLTAVRIASHGREVVVRDGDEVWSPTSGQSLFDFTVAKPAESEREEHRPRPERPEFSPAQDKAQHWYELGCELEATSMSEAQAAYRKALEADPQYVDALVNLGRALHETDDLEEAEDCYRLALEVDPEDAIAAFNLGVALEDRGKYTAALEAYAEARRVDQHNADAFFNAARICEQLGQHEEALRHLKSYRALESTIDD